MYNYVLTSLKIHTKTKQSFHEQLHIPILCTNFTNFNFLSQIMLKYFKI